MFRWHVPEYTGDDILEVLAAYGRRLADPSNAVWLDEDVLLGGGPASERKVAVSGSRGAGWRDFLF